MYKSDNHTINYLSVLAFLDDGMSSSDCGRFPFGEGSMNDPLPLALLLPELQLGEGVIGISPFSTSPEVFLGRSC